MIFKNRNYNLIFEFLISLQPITVVLRYFKLLNISWYFKVLSFSGLHHKHIHFTRKDHSFCVQSLFASYSLYCTVLLALASWNSTRYMKWTGMYRVRLQSYKDEKILVCCKDWISYLMILYLYQCVWSTKPEYLTW